MQIDDRAVIGGLAAIHQFVRVGRLAMLGGTAGVMQDVPPFCMVQGSPPATLRGLNRIGIDDVIAVDDLTDGAKYRNLLGARISDYFDKTDFYARFARAEFGKVDIPQEAFIAALKMDGD